MLPKNKWYGYVHVNGELHVKRYFDLADVIEVNQSDFVIFVCRPFEAETRDEALEILKEKIATKSILF